MTPAMSSTGPVDVYPEIHQWEQQSLSYLLRMPNEILTSIITAASLIERDEDQLFLGWRYPELECANLKSIALTCRRLYLLCIPSLWRDKEYTLSCDDKENRKDIHMTVDAFSRQTRHFNCHLGAFVRSLSQDLTHCPDYNLHNTQLLAQRVRNLRALRIDFHPGTRTEHYGLHFFAQHCASLSELYLENCRDTFNDFQSLLTFKRPLTSLTLLNCTIQECTLLELIDLCKDSLTCLLLLKVFIQPSFPSNDTTIAAASSCSKTPIPHPVYQRMFPLQSLSQLALSEPISHDLLDLIVCNSTQLDKLALVLDDINPFYVTHTIITLTRLTRLTVLSLDFREALPHVSTYQRLPCCAPARAWVYFARHLPLLRLLHVSASSLLLSPDVIKQLVSPDRPLSNVMLHHVAFVPSRLDLTTNEITELDPGQVTMEYFQDAAHSDDTVQAWQNQYALWPMLEKNFFTHEQATSAGFNCFDTSDFVCFVKGFSDWKA